MATDTIRVCTRCRGNGWDPRGGSCHVCDGAGAVYTGDAGPATFKDADDFFDSYRERTEEYPRRFRF